MALLELAEEGDDDHLPWLHQALRSDPDVEVRREAADNLGGREDEASVLSLVTALDDEEVAVRAAAAASLAELQAPATAPPLLSALARHDGPAGADRRSALLRALRGLRVAEALGPALALIDDPAAGVRREAIGVIGWLQATSALAELTRLATADPDPGVRRAATGALGLASEVASVEQALRQALADHDWEVREAAAATVGKLGAVGTLVPLGAALADDYWQVRLATIRALGRLGRGAAPLLPEILAQLDHPSSNLRKETVISLGQIGDRRALPALEGAASDPDPDVRKLARLALETLARG